MSVDKTQLYTTSIPHVEREVKLCYNCSKERSNFMSKKAVNKFLIINIAVAVTAIGLTVGSFFIGYNKGGQDANSNPNGYVVNPESEANASYKTIYGVYKTSYYNNYNKSVDSYIVFRKDGICRYTEIASERSSGLDFTQDDGNKKCTYEYDEGNGTGKIKTWYYWVGEDGKEHVNEGSEPTYKSFTFNNGLLTVGGSTYSKIQASY